MPGVVALLAGTLEYCPTPPSWQQPDVFNWLQEKGNVDATEMYRTFNCGVGMIVCVPANVAETALEVFKLTGEKAFIIGSIEHAKPDEEQVILQGL